MKIHHEGTDPLTGIEKTSWVESDGTIVFKREQDAEPAMDYAKQQRDALGEKHNFGKGGGNWHHIAEIPFTVLNLWTSMWPNWRTDPDQRKQVIARLNDIENRKFRVDQRRL